MISKPAVKRRSLRPRIFVDEVPSIDLDAALRTGTPNAINILWEADRTGRISQIGEGWLSIANNGPTDLGHIECTFSNEVAIAADKHAYIGVSKTKNGATKTRARFVCPECKGLVSHLYMNLSAWKCRKCHGLLYLSQYKADVVTDYEVYDRLMVESRRQRRPYERQAVFQRKAAAAKAKLAKLGDVERSRTYSHQRPPSITTVYRRGYDQES